MDYETIRRTVEEEVLKALSASPSTVRVRRAVVSESMVVASRRRGASSIDIPPGAVVTPAARDRAQSLGIKLNVMVTANHGSKEAALLIEAVMSSVVATLGKEESLVPRPAVRRGRRLITSAGVERARLGDGVIRLTKGDLITPLAADHAERIGVRIVRES